MSTVTKFKLENEALDVDFGTIVFNGKFVFTLSDEISPAQWKEIGFIPIPDGKKQIESSDLFYYLNSRLPINLRNESNEEKLAYIKQNGLRVASDSFVLKPISS
jgi:hypothetical protein